MRSMLEKCQCGAITNPDLVNTLLLESLIGATNPEDPPTTTIFFPASLSFGLTMF